MEKRDNLEVNVSMLEDKQAAVVALVGELDNLMIRKVEDMVVPLLEKDHSVIVDCSNLRYIGSIGLLALLRYDKRAKEWEKKFFVVSSSKYLNDLIGAAGANKLLTVYATLTEAEAAL